MSKFIIVLFSLCGCLALCCVFHIGLLGTAVLCAASLLLAASKG